MPEEPLQGAKTTTIVLSGKTRSHEEFMLAYGGLIGALYLFGLIPFPVVMSSFPWAFNMSWALMLFASAVIGIVGCRLSGRKALKLEQSGLLMASGPLLMISMLGILALGSAWRGLLGAAILGLFATAHLARALQIGRELNAIAKGTRK